MPKTQRDNYSLTAIIRNTVFMRVLSFQVCLKYGGSQTVTNT